MIYYFSGTGNTRHVAMVLARLLGETETIAVDYDTTFRLPEIPAETVGLIFPVYGWGMPKVVDSFLKCLPTKPTDRHTPYIYSVLTHGDDIGRSDDLLRKSLYRKGYPLSSVFSVAMRNTYVCLPGFDVDSSETALQKSHEADARLLKIAEAVRLRRSITGHEAVTPGAFPWFKTYILRPLFNLLLTDDRHFWVDSAECISCGKCLRVCPVHNLTADKNGRPIWNGRCTHCLACYHACPHHAIHYGRFTKGKGQVVCR